MKKRIRKKKQHQNKKCIDCGKKIPDKNYQHCNDCKKKIIKQYAENDPPIVDEPEIALNSNKITDYD